MVKYSWVKKEMAELGREEDAELYCLARGYEFR